MAKRQSLWQQQKQDCKIEEAVVVQHQHEEEEAAKCQREEEVAANAAASGRRVPSAAPTSFFPCELMYRFKGVFLIETEDRSWVGVLLLQLLVAMHVRSVQIFVPR